MRKLNKNQELEVIAIYQAGNSLTRTGKRFGISPWLVKKTLERNNITRRENENRKYTMNHRAFDDMNDEMAYWWGFIYADGCVTNAEYKKRLIGAYAQRPRKSLRERQ